MVISSAGINFNVNNKMNPTDMEFMSLGEFGHLNTNPKSNSHYKILEKMKVFKNISIYPYKRIYAKTMRISK